MDIIKRIRLISISIFFLFQTEVAFAYFNVEQWSKYAKKAEVVKDYDSAENIYLQAIEYHSANPKQYLRAYTRLFDIYIRTDQVQKLSDSLRFLESTYPNTSFDIFDEIKLSDIYIKYGDEKKGYQLKEEILNRDFNPNYVKAYIRVIKSLLKHSTGSDQVLALLNKSGELPLESLDANDSYDLALLYLKYGNPEVGTKKLEEILVKYPGSKSSAKSLFVLAKANRSSQNYETAIGFYRKYMSEFPEQTFFVQKAYQGIIDCLISLGNEGEASSLAFPLADFVNGASDPRSLFDAAENLFQKGQYDLAESTFLLGISAAKTKTDNSISVYARSLTRLHLIRAAYPLGKLEVARAENEIAIADMNTLMTVAENVTDDNEFLYSQLLLWAAKISDGFEDYAASQGKLREFLTRFPEHKDANYVRYNLVKLLMRRWEIDRLRVSDVNKKIEKHNQTVKFAEATGNLNYAKELVEAIQLSELKQEALLWTKYIQ